MKKIISFFMIASLVATMSLLCGCPNPDESTTTTTTTTIMQVKGKTFVVSTLSITFSKDTKGKIKAGTLTDGEKEDICQMAGWSDWDESVTEENIDQKVGEGMKTMYKSQKMIYTADKCKFFGDEYNYTQKDDVVKVEIDTTTTFILTVKGNKLIWEQKDNWSGDAPYTVTFVEEKQ